MSIIRKCLAVKRQVTKSKRNYSGPKHLTRHTKHCDASQDFVCTKRPEIVYKWDPDPAKAVYDVPPDSLFGLVWNTPS